MKLILSIYSMGLLASGLWLRQQRLLVTPGLFFLGGAVFGFGFWLFCKQIAILRRTRKTYGKPAGWNENGPANPDSARVYSYAVITFEAADGSEHQVTSATGSRQTPRVDHPIPVRYDPSNPDDARVATLFDFWGPSVAIMFFGGLTLVMALVRGTHFSYSHL